MNKKPTSSKTTGRKTAVPRKTKSATQAKWTVLVYLAGDNNLDAAGVIDLQEMKSVGSSESLNVVAQFDRSGKHGTTKRFRLRKGTPVASDAVDDLGETNSGDPSVLFDFLSWGADAYPADHYLVSLWNHGAGWDDSNLYGGDYFGGQPPPISHKGVRLENATRGNRPPAPAASREARIPLPQAKAAMDRAKHALFATTVEKMMNTRAIAFDDQAKDFIDNLEMKRVMLKLEKQIGRKIDILGFDACLMSMVEIAYEIRDAARYTVGSQEEEPNNGWPYDRILARIAKDPTITPGDLAKGMVDDYVASYKTSDRATLAAGDLSTVADVVTAVSMLAQALTAEVANPDAMGALTVVRSRVQEYTKPYDEYVDLIDLCDGLDAMLKRPAVTGVTRRVRDAVNAYVLRSGFKGAGVDRSHGTSIYFPKKSVCTLYSTLDFAKDGEWARFIAAYTEGLGNRAWGTR